MTLTTIWNCLSSLSRYRKDRPLPGINSEEAFRAILQRERARADRYEHVLSLVIFHLDNLPMKDQGTVRLTHILAQRKRATDEVGWSDQRSIAAILPNTTAAGARHFAEDVSRKIVHNHAGPLYTIHQYPSRYLLRDADSRRFRDDNTPPDGSNPSPMTLGEFTTNDIHPSSDGSHVFFARAIPPWKRTLDIAVSILLLICLFPFFLLIAILIQLVSPGPVFFTQPRVGYMGNLFTCWKFRTMRIGADHAVHQRYLASLIHSDTPMTKLDSRDDPRIIPLGNLLRQTGLDELPQLFNVIRGDMSLIGPRPCLPYEARQYSVWQAARFDTLPGVTGLWQVSGKNRTTFKDMMRFDLRYVRNMSFKMDVKIFLKTLPAIIGQVRDFSAKPKEEEHGARA